MKTATLQAPRHLPRTRPSTATVIDVRAVSSSPSFVSLTARGNHTQAVLDQKKNQLSFQFFFSPQETSLSIIYIAVVDFSMFTYQLEEEFSIVVPCPSSNKRPLPKVRVGRQQHQGKAEAGHHGPKGTKEKNNTTQKEQEKLGRVCGVIDRKFQDLDKKFDFTGRPQECLEGEKVIVAAAGKMLDMEAARQTQLDNLNKKGQSSIATGTNSSKEAEHDNKIKIREQEVAQMKAQMFNVKKMDPGKFEDNKELTFQVWRDDVGLLVRKIDKGFKNILQEAKKAAAEVLEKNATSRVQMGSGERTAHVLGDENSWRITKHLRDSRRGKREWS